MHYSHTHGRNVSTTAQGAHAQGSGSSANANFSHAEGLGSVTTGDDAHSEGTRTTAGGVASHAQGSGSVTAAPYAHAEGVLTRASGPYAHSEGFRTTASGTGSHAQGQLSIASNPYSNAQGLGSMVVPAGANVGLNGLSGHAEGSGSTAGALSGSHAEGVRTLTTGFDSHTEGSGSVATGTAGHAEGVQTTADNFAHSQGLGSVAAALYSHTEGERSTTTQTGGHSKGLQSSATGLYASAKGSGSVASGQSSHAEGATTTASGIGAHAEGIGSRAAGNYSHAEGLNSTASGLGAHAEGIRSTASSTYAHAEGSGSVASGIYAHAQGQGTLASSLLTTAEGLRTTANLTASHAQGQQTVASGRYSHAEGLSSIASAETAFAEGQASTAASRTSHAEGFGTRTSQIFTHTEGALGVASGLYSHAEGGSGLVDGIASHREGTNTRAAGQYSHAEGVDTVAGNLRRPDRTFMYVTPFISRSDGVISDIVLTNTGSGYQTLFVTGSITNATGVSGSVGLNIDPVLLAVSGSGSAIGAFIFNQGSNYQYPITVTFPTPTSPNGPNVAATASLYINQITPILGIPAEEDALLTFCDTQKINSLILYDLNWMDWAENGQGTVASPGKAMLKDFIVKAKTSHDVDHISAARGFDTTGSGFTQINQIRDYNIWAQENGYLDGLFDSITTEVEWWQAPIPISASHVGIVLNYADRELRNPRTTRLYSPMEINVYLGKGSNYRSTDPAIMAPFTDRWLVSTYVSYSISTGSGNLYRDTKGTTGLTRMADIATAYQNFDVKPKILPIYSAESKFSPWNKNGGFNGVNLNTWNADNDYEFMGRYYSPRFANRSLQRSYEDWTVWISSGVNTVWDRETDPLLLNNLQAEGIALFEYKLLSQSMPGITNPQNPNILIQRDNMHSCVS